MNKISTILDKKNDMAILFALLISAFIVRLIVVIFWIDVSGDAPGIAIGAYRWWHSPHMKTHGTHLPGIIYLGGLFHLFIDDPWISTRIFNMIMGSLTIPIFYLLICRIFNRSVALLSALILVFLPIHLAASGSSLKEASFLFEIIIGIWLLILASERQEKQDIYLSLSLLFFCLAEATRYEGWLLIPILPLYYWLKTKKTFKSILILLVLSVFPIFWFLGNYVHSGNIKAVVGAVSELDLERAGAREVNWKDFIRFFVHRSVSFLGPIIPPAVIIGLILQVIQITKKRISIERILYLSIFTIQWLFIFKFYFSRGGAVWNRYLLLGLVLALPFASLALSNLRNYRQQLGIIITITVVSAFTFFLPQSFHFQARSLEITRQQPTEIKNFAAWLEKSSYRNDSIIVTEMTKNRRKQRYLRLYFPEVSYRILTIWDQEEIVPNSKLKEFLEEKKPSLLITSKDDDKLKTRVEDHLSEKLSEKRLVYQEKYLKVYDIAGLYSSLD